MLQEIKSYIEEISDDKDFGQFYQEYVRSCQDKILTENIRSAESNFATLEDTTAVIQGINNLTKELKNI